MPPGSDDRSLPVPTVGHDPGPAPGGSLRDRLGRVNPALIAAAAVLALSVLLHLRDPHRSGSWGLCPWLLLTHTYCPFCGGLRAVNDLTHGEVREAASANLLLMASMPVVGVLWARTVVHRWRGDVSTMEPRWVLFGSVLFAVLALAFAVARNTVVGGWLAP